ncbi:hypothetical protein GCM10008910_23150 [Faecalicatena orotica]
MADAIKGDIEYNKAIKGIDFTTKTVIAKDGTTYQADVIITTIPWMEFDKIIGMPKVSAYILGMIEKIPGYISVAGAP